MDLEYHLLKILSLIISFGILLFGILLKKLNEGIHNPGSIFCYFWFLSTLFASLVLWWVPIHPFSTLYIFLACISFGLPSFFLKVRPSKYVQYWYGNVLSKSARSRKFKLILYTLCVLAIIANGRFLSQNNFKYSDFASNFIQTAISVSNNRTLNEEDYIYGFWGIITIQLSQIVVILGAILYLFRDKFKGYFLFLLISFTPVVILTLTHSTKQYLLIALINFFGTIIGFNIIQGKKRIFTTRVSKKNFLILILALGIIFFSFGLRQGYDDFNLAYFTPTILSYLFGSVYAFSDYFLYHNNLTSFVPYYFKEDLTYGYYTFKSVFDIFDGTKVFPIGYYVNPYSYEGIQTNIFTIYRALIQDFNVIGSFQILFILGLIFHLVYISFLRSKYTLIGFGGFILFFNFTVYGYLQSIFVSRDKILTILVIIIVLSILKIKIYAKGYSQQ